VQVDRLRSGGCEARYGKKRVGFSRIKDAASPLSLLSLLLDLNESSSSFTTTALVRLVRQATRQLSPHSSQLVLTCLPSSHRNFHSPLPLHRVRHSYIPMDIPALTSRLSALGLAPSTAEGATPVLSYFFTPKSGSKHPDNAEQDLKLVVVSIEESKNLGAAKALATSVGLKDMRAVSGADLEKLLGRTRDQGTFSFPLCERCGEKRSGCTSLVRLERRFVPSSTSPDSVFSSLTLLSCSLDPLPPPCPRRQHPPRHLFLPRSLFRRIRPLRSLPGGPLQPALPLE
jgi:hypothetical protein